MCIIRSQSYFWCLDAGQGYKLRRMVQAGQPRSSARRQTDPQCIQTHIVASSMTSPDLHSAMGWRWWSVFRSLASALIRYVRLIIPRQQLWGIQVVRRSGQRVWVL